MKRSGISICFAVFAAIIMLITTCIAQPVQAEVTMDTIEYKQQELINSINKMKSKMETDIYLNNLGVQISKDTKINSIVNSFKNTDPEDYNTQLSLARSLSDYLPKMQAYLSFKNYFERSYSYYITTINTKANELMSLSNQYQNNIVNSPEADAVPVIGLATDGYYSIDNENIQSTSSTKLSLTGDNTYTPEATEPDLAGFLRNMNGDIYVPGYGWVSKTDPYYNYFLSLEDYLDGMDGNPDLQDWIVLILLFVSFYLGFGWSPLYWGQVLFVDAIVIMASIIYPPLVLMDIFIMASNFLVAWFWVWAIYLLCKYGPPDIP